VAERRLTYGKLSEWLLKLDLPFSALKKAQANGGFVRISLGECYRENRRKKRDGHMRLVKVIQTGRDKGLAQFKRQLRGLHTVRGDIKVFSKLPKLEG
jgi:hypothetical protein